MWVHDMDRQHPTVLLQAQGGLVLKLGERPTESLGTVRQRGQPRDPCTASQPWASLRFPWTLKPNLLPHTE